MTGPSTVRRFVVVALVAVALAACSSDSDPSIDGRGEPGPADTGPDTPAPSTIDATADPTAQEGQQPEDFTTVRALITEPDGEVCEVCLWLADDPAERGRGLMGVTDLGDAVGMAFRFDEPTTGSFYMFQTPSPLSIAWFSPDGSLVGSADMDPCLDTPAGECPLYSPGAEYDLAIEVFEGGLEPLGLVAGSSVELIEGSEAERCAVAP
jgi:uncharacterized membrane protein (UPF0127 family)